MQFREMIERLERAQREVKLVEEQLNDRAHPCATCGCKIREDYTQYLVREQLAAVHLKLKRLAGSLASRATPSRS